MPAEWTDAKILYFHFLTSNGAAASLPMTRTLKAFPQEFKGIPGTKEMRVHGRKAWVVPGYTCINCGGTFFSPDQDGLKHGCTNHGGIISAKA